MPEVDPEAAAQQTLVLVRDLLFASRITSAARDAGVMIKLIRDPTALASEPGARVIVDLNQPGALDAAAAWCVAKGKPATGFASHVDTETIARARAAGIARVLSRGQFTQTLGDVLRGIG